MDMITMLAIITVVYFTALFFLCLYREEINIKIGNLIFVILDVIFFFCWMLAMHPKGWLDDGFETLENISPLMFTLIPLTYVMKGKVRDCCFSTIALLSAGMFVAIYVSPEYEYVVAFRREADFLYTSEAICHMICSLFGAYLVLTNQVKPNFSSWIKSIIFLYSIITYAVVLNFAFHKSFFGMDPYGDYSIYMIDIFGSFEATLVAFYIGVLLVLTIGMQIAALLDKLASHKFIETFRHHKEKTAPIGEGEAPQINQTELPQTNELEESEKTDVQTE